METLNTLYDGYPNKQIMGMSKNYVCVHYIRALDIRSRYGCGFYDSLILSAAIEGGCDRLLSEDLQDGQQEESIKIVNPFY